MEEWIERILVALIIFFIVVAGIGLYTTWRDCEESGGIAVRGMFGIECIAR